MACHRNIWAGMLALGVFAIAAASAEKAGPSVFYEKISDAYLKGDFSTVELLLQGAPKEPADLTPAQQADVAYVRQAMLECHPAWWESCKSGGKVQFAPALWGQAFGATYDPAGKSQFNIQLGTKKSVTVSWPRTEMDNPANAEHGFTHGDLANLATWQTLGRVAVLVNLQPKAFGTITTKDKVRLQRYSEFRANITGAYYGSPKSRRWALWLALAGFMDKYAQMQYVETRKAVGSWFLVEVLTNPQKYSSLKLTAPAPEATEKALADHYRVHIEKKSWTIAEDKALREALKSFAAANDLSLFQSQRVTLPNRLFFALDGGEDAPLASKRNDWLKGQLRMLAK